jgi:anti-sigma regulatory factor (Ser/Thr protein kinase)
MTPPPESVFARETGSPSQLRLELQRDLGAPARARAAVTRSCDQLELDALLCQSLVLLVSEVVTNAVRHSTGPSEAPIELIGAFTGETIRITVTDAGHGFTPQPRDPGRTHDGYGLYLLENVARQWGVESNGETSVWFELPRSPSAFRAPESARGSSSPAARRAARP